MIFNRDVFWAFSGQASRLVLQVVLFAIIAKGMGARDFGLYTSIFSMSQVAYPLSGLGTHNSMIMQVSRSPETLNSYVATPAVLTLIVGGVFSIVGYFSSSILFFENLAAPTPAIVFFIFFTELVAFRLIDVSTHAWQASRSLRLYAVTYLALSFARVIAAFIVIVIAKKGLLSWALCNCILTGIFAVASLCALKIERSLSLGKISVSPAHIKDGWGFAVSGLGQALYSNLDKIIITSTLGLEAVGVYAVAQRVASIAFLPVLSIFQANYVDYFVLGKDGLAATLRRSLHLSKGLMPYGLVCFFLLYLGSALLPWVLGESYKASANMLKVMSIIPGLQVMHYLLGEALTGAGFQRVRSTCQIVAGMLGCSMMYMLIKAVGRQGLPFSAVLSEVFLLSMYVLFVLYRSKPGLSTNPD